MLEIDTIFGQIKIESRAQKGNDSTFLMPGNQYFHEDSSTVIRGNISIPSLYLLKLGSLPAFLPGCFQSLNFNVNQICG